MLEANLHQSVLVFVMQYTMTTHKDEIIVVRKVIRDFWELSAISLLSVQPTDSAC